MPHRIFISSGRCGCCFACCRYDGHGGPEVAQHCADNLHRHFATQLSLASKGPNSQQQPENNGRDGCQDGSGPAREIPEPGASGAEDQRGAERNSNPQASCQASGASEGADPRPGPSGACDDNCGSLSTAAGGANSTQVVVDALSAAFQLTDQELAGTDAGDYVGATAVVAVLGKSHIWIAHCGKNVLQFVVGARRPACQPNPQRGFQPAPLWPFPSHGASGGPVAVSCFLRPRQKTNKLASFGSQCR